VAVGCGTGYGSRGHLESADHAVQKEPEKCCQLCPNLGDIAEKGSKKTSSRNWTAFCKLIVVPFPFLNNLSRTKIIFLELG
jgi:hypothetical protein